MQFQKIERHFWAPLKLREILDMELALPVSGANSAWASKSNRDKGDAEGRCASASSGAGIGPI